MILRTRKFSAALSCTGSLKKPSKRRTLRSNATQAGTKSEATSAASACSSYVSTGCVVAASGKSVFLDTTTGMPFL